MSDETKHPERRAGQRWNYDFDGQHQRPGRVFTLTKEHNGIWDALDDKGHESCFASERELAEFPQMFRLLVDAPAVDRSACEAWCGHRQDVSREMGRKGGWGCSNNAPGENALWWCSPACRDAKHPPLSAQPAEANNCADHGGYACTCGMVRPCNDSCNKPDGHPGMHTFGPGAKDWPAEQPKPAKPSLLSCATCGRSADVCQFACVDKMLCAATGCPCKGNPAKGPACRLVGIGPHVCGGALATRIMRGLPVGLYCEQAYRTREASISQLTRVAPPFTDILRDPAIPERIVKPPMAHSSQWADEAEDVR